MAQSVYVPIVRCLADVEPVEVQWLWPGRFALGKLSLIFGDPGRGKSFVTLDMAARVSTGREWPDGRANSIGPADAILMSCEDDLADTIRPRLDKAGADVRRVHHLQSMQRKEEGKAPVERFITLNDLAQVEIALAALRECRLVVVDPVSAYMGTTDSHNNADVRGVLAPWAKLAADYGVAFVMVTHLNKSGVGNALNRAQGSMAFGAVARTAFAVAPDKDDPSRRLMLPAKSNISTDQGGLAFRINDGRVHWESGAVYIRADDALAIDQGGGRSAPGPEPTKRSAAAEWLRDYLAAGAKKCGDRDEPEPGTVRHDAREAGFSESTLRRAVSELRIKPYKGQFDKAWYWELLPAPPEPEPLEPPEPL